MKKLLLILFFWTVLFSVELHAQFVDSIQISLMKKPKFSFRFDNRNSFVTHSRADIVGIKVGAEFDNRFRIGGGLNFLSSRITKPQLIDSAGIVVDTVVSILKMSYFGYYIEYVFYRSKRWEFSIPIQLGFGNTRYDYAYRGKGFKASRKFVLIYESNIIGHYKIFPWFGVGAGIGYQLMLIDNPAIKENFNSPIYVLKMKIFFGDIYRAIFPKKNKKGKPPK